MTKFILNSVALTITFIAVVFISAAFHMGPLTFMLSECLAGAILALILT